MTTATPHTIEFDWLGTHVTVRCDREDLASVVRRLWGLARGEGERSREREYVVETEGIPTPVFRGPEGPRPLDRRDPALHAYNLLVSDLLGIVHRHFVFHATAVRRDGRALVVSGPSTYGKTTLGLHLSRLGFDLHADDVTIIERGTSRVLPFRRSLRLRPGTRETLDAETLEHARAGTREVLGEEWAVDPVAWSGGPSDPCPISLLVVLRHHGDGAGVRRFPFYEIRVVEGRESLLDELGGLPGVERAELDAGDPSHARVEVRDAAPLVGWLREHSDSLVYGIKQAPGPPSFDGEPRLEPLGHFQAALEMCQEMLNRHEGSRLADEFRDREPMLVAEVAQSLAGASCYALLPGRLDETLALLTSRFEEASP